MATPDLLIVGGSVRAAAWCAVRAGLKVAALDRYNDLDLLAVAEPCFKWDGSDEQVERVVGELGVPWMYTGPLENRPDLVDRCAALAPLRGNPGDVLRAVRDPVRVRTVLREAGLPALEVRVEHDPPPADGTWLLKPRASCGGRGIVVWNRKAAGHPTLREPHYFQERDGFRPPYVLKEIDALHHCSAVGVRVKREVRPLGHTDWLDPPVDGGAEDFAFRSLSAWNVPVWSEPMSKPAFALAEAFELEGPFSVDFAATVGRGDDPPEFLRVVEVNPRFTASMDLLRNPFGREDPPTHLHAGKRIVFAPFDCRAPELPLRKTSFLDGVADVPAPGSLIKRGEPVCSVLEFTPGDGRPSVTARRIAALAKEVTGRLAPA
ncbi:hypothetical protein [Alienimonas sp. DA493]|uniref:hypothetical protein n=1 Tax=Alienimonas sp. DA493 TaxID=3373605 RepID=UPI00375529DF